MKKINQNLEILTFDKLEEIYKTSPVTLEDIGCHIPDKKILEILKYRGADVDLNNNVIAIPEGVPSEIVDIYYIF